MKCCNLYLKVLPVLLLLTFLSCTKEQAEQLECESEDIGYVTITSTSDNPYDVYLDGELIFRLQGNSFKDDYEISTGTHILKTEQVSGYILYPTVREKEIVIAQCEKQSWVFP